MQERNRLSIALLAMRVSIFVVMLVWTLDKFLDPAHAAAVFEKFYALENMGTIVIYAIGAIEMAILLGFLLGILRRWTYVAILAFHTVSTLAPFQMYLNPSEGRLFFAAWPMLAACFALYLLRDHDNLWVVGKTS